jgi:hypothetical protein
MIRSWALSSAQRRKNQRESRSPEQIRQDLDRRSAASRLARASQRFQNTQLDISMYHPPSAPTSSSSTATQNTNDNCVDDSKNNDLNAHSFDRSITSSPYSQQLSMLTSVATYALVITIIRYIFIKSVEIF